MDLPESVGAVHVVIVDNGAEQSLAADPPALKRSELEVTVVHEARRGIPFARNASVAVALERAPAFLAFVDDDERVDRRWLVELLAAAGRYEADVVWGPVVPHFSPGAPAWAVKSGLYGRDRFPTGHLLTWAATNNTLVRADVFSQTELWFDGRFAKSGGSDAEFFRRVYTAGRRLVWCDEAIVTEWFPRDRLRLRWVARRALRVGSVRGSELVRTGTLTRRQRMLRLVRTVGKLVLGPPRLLLDLRHGWRAIRHLRQMVFNVGLLLGMAGVVVPEYGSGPSASPS